MRKRVRIMALALCLLLAASAAAEDGAWFVPYNKKEGSLRVTFGRYPQRADGAEEPILWRALRLEGGTVYLMSEYILDVARLHSLAFGYPGWDKADLNAWLQTEFIARAFSPAEAAALVSVSGLGKASLPSVEDLRSADIGFDSDLSRRTRGTPWADSRGLFFYRNKGHSPYWTRTPSAQEFAHRSIKLEGNIGYLGVTADDMGVRPVVWLQADRVAAASGSGTLADPLVLVSLGEPSPSSSDAAQPAPSAAPAIPEGPLPAGGAVPEASAPGMDAWARTGALNTEGFPPLDPEGFLPEGEPEYVFIDPENGRWRYASQNLRIVIRKELNAPLQSRILTADVYLRQGGEGFRMVPHSPGNLKVDRDAYKDKPAQIARDNRLVFSMDGDYFIYRVSRAIDQGPSYPVGVVIRAGEVLFDKPPRAGREAYPPLDMLALHPGGGMRVYAANEMSVKELLATGARDVLSFGPILVRDGKLGVFHELLGNTLQPRAGVGMVAPGHYVAIIVEGRIRESKGITVRQLAQLMLDLGCTTAFNLDGGWTSAMVFMGAQLNQLDNTGVKNNARIQNEVMGIGQTDAFR